MGYLIELNSAELHPIAETNRYQPMEGRDGRNRSLRSLLHTST
jgi:hypothetical protein